MSKAEAGWYSLVQVVPEPSRGEALNIGVVLFATERRQTIARLSGDTTRVRRLMPHPLLQNRRFGGLLKAFGERLESLVVSEEAEVTRFVQARADLFRLTPPRPIQFESASETVGSLYRDLVEAGDKRAVSRAHAPHRAFADLKRDPEVSRRLREPRSIALPHVPFTVKTEASYRNGKETDLIVESLALADPRDNFERASGLALLGEELRAVEPGRRLAVFANFSFEEFEAFLKERLRRHGVAVFGEREVEQLRQDILQADPVEGT